MHELGHNFNTAHTHDGYSPLVDTCGVSCPSQLPLAKSATIMSYCDLCPGGIENYAHTFGGKYKGTGSRSDPNSYNNSPLAGTVSFEPRRVNAKMWASVSSRGTCTQPPVTSPPSPSPYTAPITNLALSEGSIRQYYIDIAAGQSVSCSTNGPDGDADLYVRFGFEAVPDAAFAGNACSSTSEISNESCSTSIVTGPTKVYAAVHAYSSFSGLAFQCTVRTPTSKPTSKPTTRKPTRTGTSKPTTRKPTSKPTTRKPTYKPTTRKPTYKPTTRKPVLF